MTEGCSANKWQSQKLKLSLFADHNHYILLVVWYKDSTIKKREIRGVQHHKSAGNIILHQEKEREAWKHPGRWHFPYSLHTHGLASSSVRTEFNARSKECIIARHAFAKL